MNLFSLRAFRMWQRNRDVFFRLWKSEVPGFVAEPFIVLLALGLGLGAYVGFVNGVEYIAFIAPGIVASYAMFTAVFECTYGTFARMEFQNTYDAILATPLSAEDIIAGEVLWAASRSVLTGTVILIIAWAMQLVHSPWALLVPVVCFFLGILFASIALMYTAIVPAIYSFNYFYTLFINPIFFLSGIFFPLDQFPPIVQNLAWISPLTPVVHLMRACFQGKFDMGSLGYLAYIVVAIVLIGAAATVMMKRRLTR